MTDFTIIWNLLREFFNYEYYNVGVQRIREQIAQSENYKESWYTLKQVIVEKRLKDGEPLELIHNGANQMLDDNTDEEAYVWFAKLIENVERTDGVIDEY